MIITSNKINKIFFGTLVLFPLFMFLLLSVSVYGNEQNTIKTEIHVYKINGETNYCNGLFADDVNIDFVLYDVPDLHIHDLLQIEIDTNNHEIISWKLWQSFTRDGKLLYKNETINSQNDVSVKQWYKQNYSDFKIKKIIYEPY